MIGISFAIALGALSLSTLASANLIVIGSKDIQVNQLTGAQLSAIFLGRSVSLATNETLNPIDQDPNSKIYAQFYELTSDMDPSSVNSYWSGLTFSGTGTQPPEVADDQSAIASVENSHKAIAYIDSADLGVQIANVKVLYGTIPENEQATQQPSADTSANNTDPVNPYFAQHRASDEALREKLAQEIAATQLQEQRYQQLNDERQKELLEILKAEKKDPNNMPGLASLTSLVGNSTNSGNLWTAMRSHFELSSHGHSQAVNKQLAWYVAHKWIVQMIIKNSEPYIGYVYQQTQQRHMPAEFALLPMVESGYVPFADSSAGAAGLWQIMPNTASSNGIKINWWYDGRLDIVHSTNAALDYLLQLKNNVTSWALAAAAYNDGEGDVLSAIDYNKRKGLSTDYWSLPLPHETREYVPKLLALAEIIRNPSRYGITLPALTTQPTFSVITLHSQLDRKQIANLTGTTKEVIHELNPGMLRWATSAHGVYDLVIPTDDLATFKINMARLADKKRLLWVYHSSANQSLADIANQYHTTVARLTKVNDLQAQTFKSGMGLLVPIVSQKTYAGLYASVAAQMSPTHVARPLVATNKKLPVVPSAPAIMAHATPTAIIKQPVTKASDDSINQVSATALLQDAYASKTHVAGTTTQTKPLGQLAQQSTRSGANSNDLKQLMNQLYE